MTDEQAMEHRLQITHHGGAAGALEHAAAEFSRMAGEAFSRRAETSAEVLRDVAEKLEEMAKVRRQQQAPHKSALGHET